LDVCKPQISFFFARHISLAGYVADLLEIMAALDLRDTLYVGHSTSGMIGMLAARPARALSAPDLHQCLATLP
jgi:pimeloyl-ACP methyl ester carboxylesterase